MPSPIPQKVLLALHPTFDTLDYAGPLETFAHTSTLTSKTPLFHTTTTAVDALTTSEQGVTITSNISISEAHATLADYDVLLIPGGGSSLVLSGQNANEPIELIKAFAALPKKPDGSIRTLMSVCTGSLFLAAAGVLGGGSGVVTQATTHPGYYGKLREVLSEGGGAATEVVETTRFVANRVDEAKGLRVVTAGGVSCGIDAALWLVGEVGGKEVREHVEWILQHTFVDGIVV